MIDLIPEVLQATVPSRELDAQIYCALHKSAYANETPEQHLAYALQCCPQYTASIDAALTLMRKHYLWQLKQGIGCTAIVWWIEHDWDDTGAPTAHSTTYPALALTTAILIARAVEDRVSTTAFAPHRGSAAIEGVAIMSIGTPPRAGYWIVNWIIALLILAGIAVALFVLRSAGGAP